MKTKIVADLQICSSVPLSSTLKGTQVLSDSFLRYENYDFENFTMQNYMILVTSLAVNFCLQTSKTI